jgi:hypothetical protein
VGWAAFEEGGGNQTNAREESSVELATQVEALGDSADAVEAINSNGAESFGAWVVSQDQGTCCLSFTVVADQGVQVGIDQHISGDHDGRITLP